MRASKLHLELLKAAFGGPLPTHGSHACLYSSFDNSPILTVFPILTIPQSQQFPNPESSLNPNSSPVPTVLHSINPPTSNSPPTPTVPQSQQPLHSPRPTVPVAATSPACCVALEATPLCPTVAKQPLLPLRLPAPPPPHAEGKSRSSSHSKVTSFRSLFKALTQGPWGPPEHPRAEASFPPCILQCSPPSSSCFLPLSPPFHPSFFFLSPFLLLSYLHKPKHWEKHLWGGFCGGTAETGWPAPGLPSQQGHL